LKSHDACLYKIAYPTDAEAAGDKWEAYMCVYCGAWHRATPRARRFTQQFQAKKKGHLDWMVRSALRKIQQKAERGFV
jgi:predicted RNase H-like nuclease